MLNWIGASEEFSAPALTVRAQTIPLDDQGNLLWDAFMPRRNVDSVKISTIISEDETRYTADRREWDARGRLIPLATPSGEELEMTPIESYFKIAEREIQELEERTLGDEALMRRLIGVNIPSRIDKLVRANLRRIEYEVFRAWSTGTFVVRNPQLGHVSQTFSYGIDVARYQTAGTVWTDPGLNAFDQFLQWLDAQEDLVGPISGAVMRRATYNMIQADATAAINAGGSAIPRLTRREFEDRVTNERGRDFSFYIIENTLQLFGDGGTATTSHNLWPSATIAAVPADEQVGHVAFAPIARAMQMARANPGARIDVRGMAVFHEFENNYRALTTECQVNAMPVLHEQRIAVITGVGA